MATSLPWFPAWDMEMAHKGIVKRNLGYTCTLINRCRALLQRLLHLVISETAPVYVAQLIKCFGVWKVKVCINQCIFIVWYRQNYILAFSLESGIICVSSFLNSLINVVLTYLQHSIYGMLWQSSSLFYIPMSRTPLLLEHPHVQQADVHFPWAELWGLTDYSKHPLNVCMGIFLIDGWRKWVMCIQKEQEIAVLKSTVETL